MNIRDQNTDNPPYDSRGNKKELRELWDNLLDNIRDHNISRFLDFFIGECRTMDHKFFSSPAARSENPGHHAFKGGLAYHTLNAARLAGQIADHYNKLDISVNRDIVVAGVILHDIGKVDCYKWKDGPRTEYYHGEEVEMKAGYSHTKIGKMFHHIPHGFQMFMSAAKEFNELASKLNNKHTLTEKKIQHLAGGLPHRLLRMIHQYL